jgi:hypothetical protein
LPFIDGDWHEFESKQRRKKHSNSTPFTAYPNAPDSISHQEMAKTQSPNELPDPVIMINFMIPSSKMKIMVEKWTSWQNDYNVYIDIKYGRKN